MAESIDSLQIEINAQAVKANQAIDRLVDKIDKLTTSMNKLGNIEIQSFSNSIKTFSNGMKNLQNVKMPDFNRVAKGIGKISSVNSDDILKFGNALTPLANGIKTLSTANFDSKNLQGLLNSVSKLSSANVSGLSNVDFSKVGKSINRLAVSLSDAPKIQQSVISMTNSVGNIAKSADKIPLASSSLKTLSKALRKFISDMSGSAELSESTINFTNSISVLAKTGNTMPKTTSNLGALGAELKKFMKELSTAPAVSQNIIDMTNALAKLARTGASSGTAANSLAKSFNRVSVASKGLKINLLGAVTGFKSLGRQLLSAVGLAGGLYAVFNGIKKSINIASDLTEVQNVVDVTFGDFKKKIEDLSKISIPTLGISELETKQTASRFQAMGTAMGFAQGKMSNMSVELTKLSADMASFYNVEQKAVAEDLESVFTGQTRPLRTYGLDLTQATLQEWALKNGLDANIKSMSQAEKTMLRYQYVMANTGAAQGDFLRTQDTWANQVRILTYNLQQLGSVIGGTLINAFKPLLSALNTVIGKFISFAETVSNALGKIFGWKYESGGGGATGLADDMESASGSAGGIAKNTGKAAKNIEKMKAGLRAFDELKTISMPDNNSGSGSGSGGSGGSGGGGASGGSGGQWKKQKTIFEDYQSSIDSLYELGKYIGDSLMDTMDSIPWESIYKKAEQFGTGLASFLNGLFEENNGKTVLGCVGETIAGALNTALYFLNSFGTEFFKWDNFANSIADGINRFFGTFKPKLAADAINTWIKGVLKTATKAMKKTDFEEIGKKIGEFLKELDLIEITGDLAGTIWEAIKSAFSLVKGLFEEAPLESALITAFAVLKFTGLGDKVASAASTAIGEKLQTISIPKAGVTIAALVVAVEAIKWDIDIAKEIYGASQEEGMNGGSILDDALNELWSDVVSGNFKFQLPFDIKLPSIKELGLDKWWEGFVKTIKTAEQPFDSVKKGIEDAIKAIKKLELKSWFEKDIKPWFTKEKWSELGENIKSSIKTKWDELKTWFSGTAVGEFMTKIKTNFTKDKFMSNIGSIKEAFEEKWKSLKTWFSNTAVANWWSNFTTSFSKDKFKSKIGSIKESFEEKWKSMKTWFSNTAVANFWTSFSTNFSKDKFKSKIGSIKSAFNERWNDFKKWWNKLELKFPKPKLPKFKIDGSFSLNPPKVPSIKIDGWYKTGGYLPSKYSLVGAGENGIPEILGSVGGKPAVAGGAEITGIRDAVYSVGKTETELLTTAVSLLKIISQKDYGISTSDIGKAAQQYSRDYLNRTGRPAYDF